MSGNKICLPYGVKGILTSTYSQVRMTHLWFTNGVDSSEMRRKLAKQGRTPRVCEEQTTQMMRNLGSRRTQKQQESGFRKMSHSPKHIRKHRAPPSGGKRKSCPPQCSNYMLAAPGLESRWRHWSLSQQNITQLTLEEKNRAQAELSLTRTQNTQDFDSKNDFDIINSSTDELKLVTKLGELTIHSKLESSHKTATEDKESKNKRTKNTNLQKKLKETSMVLHFQQHSCSTFMDLSKKSMKYVFISHSFERTIKLVYQWTISFPSIFKSSVADNELALDISLASR